MLAFAPFDAAVSAGYHLITAFVDVIDPVLGDLAITAAIVAFTAVVRILLLPLSYIQARGSQAQAKLMPQVQQLRVQHADDPDRMKQELASLYQSGGGAMLAGCLPALIQLPFFSVMYRLFVSATIAGAPNALLSHTLFGAPLGKGIIATVGAAGLFSVPTLACFAVIGVIALVATWSSRRMPEPTGPAAAAGKVMRLLPYATVVFALFVPLAAAVYLAVSTAWTATERAILRARFASAPENLKVAS